MKKRIVKLLILFSLLSVQWGCSALPSRYIRTETQSPVTLDEILRQLEDQRVIFVGEMHADPASQSLQFEIIRHLFGRGKNIVIAMEIFPLSKQHVLDRWIEGKISRAGFMEVFRREVNLPFEPYQEIFDFARTMGIPIAGIDAEQSGIKMVSKYGTGTTSEDFLEEIKFTGCAENPEYREALGLPEEREYHQTGMPYICDAQRLRDTIMALNIAELLKNNYSTVVVLTGLVHASRIAVPKILQQYITVSTKIILPYEIKMIIKKGPGPDVADYIWY